MPSGIEAEISRLLLTEQETEKVAANLIKRWRSNLLSPAEQSDCAQFLINCGFYPSVFKELRRVLDSGATLPWAQVAEALGRSGIKPSKNEFQAIFEGVETQDAMSDLLRSNQLDLFHRKLAEKRSEYRKKASELLKGRKQALKEKLEFMRSNRLIEQEAKLLEEIQNLFPGEKDILAEAESFNVRWAKEVVSSSVQQSNTSMIAANSKWKSDQLTPEQVTAKGLILEQARQLAKKDPQAAYDLAMSLHMMEFHKEALEVLEAVRSRAADWLRIELMLHSRQFVTALEYAAQLEVEYASEPESSFATVYAKARALHGLGQINMAIDLLRSLLRIRPNYRSAQSLLMDWTGGDV